jgi:hypothetical protein
MLAQPAQRLATALQEHSDISGSNANNRRAIGRSFATDLLSVHHASLADRGSRATGTTGVAAPAHPDICVEYRLGGQQRSCPAAFRKAGQCKSFGVGSSEALPASGEGIGTADQEIQQNPGRYFSTELGSVCWLSKQPNTRCVKFARYGHRCRARDRVFDQQVILGAQH